MELRNTRDMTITVANVALAGTFEAPADPVGRIVFVHGGGRSRCNVRHREAAQVFHACGLATLLFDLLTPAEDERDALTTEFRFDIPLLARRLTHILDWVADDPDTDALPSGLFGVGTGAAAALIAAAVRPQMVRAVVSSGGRPDLAEAALDQVRAPTLLIVGNDDQRIIALNVQAAHRLRCRHGIAIVPGTTQPSSEGATSGEVTRLAIDWFRRHLIPPQRPEGSSCEEEE